MQNHVQNQTAPGCCEVLEITLAGTSVNLLLDCMWGRIVQGGPSPWIGNIDQIRNGSRLWSGYVTMWRKPELGSNIDAHGVCRLPLDSTSAKGWQVGDHMCQTQALLPLAFTLRIGVVLGNVSQQQSVAALIEALFHSPVAAQQQLHARGLAALVTMKFVSALQLTLQKHGMMTPGGLLQAQGIMVKPPTVANHYITEPTWVLGRWGQCSNATCGGSGVRNRIMSCSSFTPDACLGTEVPVSSEGCTTKCPVANSTADLASSSNTHTSVPPKNHISSTVPFGGEIKDGPLNSSAITSSKPSIPTGEQIKDQDMLAVAAILGASGLAVASIILLFFFLRCTWKNSHHVKMQDVNIEELDNNARFSEEIEALENRLSCTAQFPPEGESPHVPLTPCMQQLIMDLPEASHQIIIEVDSDTLKNADSSLHGLCPAYSNGEKVEWFYYSHQMWMAGVIRLVVMESTDADLPQVQYTVCLSNGQKHHNVPLDCIRLPVDKGELVDMHSSSLDQSWLSGIVSEAQAVKDTLMRYTLMFDSQDVTLRGVPSTKVRRRFPIGSPFVLYRGIEFGWEPAVVHAVPLGDLPLALPTPLTEFSPGAPLHNGYDDSIPAMACPWELLAVIRDWDCQSHVSPQNVTRSEVEFVPSYLVRAQIRSMQSKMSL